MFAIIQSLFFAVAETIFAWHMLTCNDHNQTTAFLFALLAGAFWLMLALNVVEYKDQRRN